MKITEFKINMWEWWTWLKYHEILAEAFRDAGISQNTSKEKRE